MERDGHGASPNKKETNAGIGGTYLDPYSFPGDSASKSLQALEVHASYGEPPGDFHLLFPGPRIRPPGDNSPVRIWRGFLRTEQLAELPP